MIEGTSADAILNTGERILDRSERFKGYPSLPGLDSAYSMVKLTFDPHFEKKLESLAKVCTGVANNTSTGSNDCTSSVSLPTFSFNEEDMAPTQIDTMMNISEISLLMDANLLSAE